MWKPFADNLHVCNSAFSIMRLTKSLYRCLLRNKSISNLLATTETYIIQVATIRLRTECRRPACTGGKKQRSNMHCRCFLGQASSWKRPLRLALTEFKHINKHVFVRMWRKFMPASGSSTLPRRT
jgi:hypothetical protein